MDLGRVNSRTRTRYASQGARGPLKKSSRTDRWGRELGLRNPEGKPYEPCPMCEKRSAVRTRIDGDTIWRCESCGYVDSDTYGALV